MDKIEVFSLGGIGENGKNMFVVEINNNIFVLDTGIKYPNSELYGIDQVIPDFSYLVKNKDRIIGIFLTHGHDVHIQALPIILTEINVPVYGSNFTISIVEDLLQEEGLNDKAYKLIRQKENEPLFFDGTEIGFFHTTHNIPDSYGVYIKTKHGHIIYTSDYNFDQNSDKFYKTSYNKLIKFSEEKVLLLLSDSLGADKYGSNGNHIALTHKLNNIMQKAKSRIIFSIFSSDIRSIQKTIDLALEYNKRIAIIGRKTQRIVDIAIKTGFLKISNEALVNLRYIDEKNKNKDKDLVIIVAGVRHEPYFMIQRMCKKIDRLIHIDKEDYVVFMTSPYVGTERLTAKTFDELAKKDSKVIQFTRQELQYSHAFPDEIKLLYNLLKPKYSMPVIGEYRHQYAHKNICLELGYKEEDIFIVENGEAVVIENGIFKEKYQKVKTSDILVDGSISGDINEVVLKDRELLAEDGILIISSNVDARRRLILSGPEINTKGFLIVKDNQDVLDGIKKVFKDVSQEFLKTKYLQWNEFKNKLRLEISNYIFKTTQRSPLIIPVIISTELSSK